jgi:predicted unusual protein kinase regulating ubiquinone biosynthesis (AarF/ABC1/UbiB family)
MKEQNSIPTSKVQRAAKFVKTGVKVGGNYLKHYGKKMLDPGHSREELDKNNADDIYGALSELKGSALKVAQMMSMDKNMLPRPYQDKFMMAQYSAPPLSFPLVVKTFRQHFGKGPLEIFDTFSQQAINAASIGQVHLAKLDGKKLAVKIQYPGVAESVSSDLKIVKPFAIRLLNISEKDLDHYMAEVEERLLEETDYLLEVQNSIEISEACSHIQHLVFPQYYPELSGSRIISMDWVDGMHLRDFMLTNPSEELRNKIGQALWDFYDFQIHTLQKVHADPHPGNFIITPEGKLGVIDFGCIKVMPDDFYQNYFALIKKDIFLNPQELENIFIDLEFITEADSPKEKAFFTGVFQEMISLLGKPFHLDEFDFGNEAYFKEIFDLGERISNSKEFKSSRQARGSRHGLYINRTYFGLYNILHDLKAKVVTKKEAFV